MCVCVYTLEAQMYRVTTSSNHYRHEPQTSYSCHSLAWRRACIHDPIIAFKRKINEGRGGNKKEKKERKRDKRNLKMWIAGTIGVHLAGNVQKISLHLYKNEQAYNGTCSQTKQHFIEGKASTDVSNSYMVFIFSPFLIPSFSLSLLFFYFVFFFQYNITFRNR